MEWLGELHEVVCLESFDSRFSTILAFYLSDSSLRYHNRRKAYSSDRMGSNWFPGILCASGRDY